MAWIPVFFLMFFAHSSLAFSVVAADHAKSWTFVFAEDGRWQAHSIGLDAHGWPQVLDQKYFPDARTAQGYAQQSRAIRSPPLDGLVLRNANGVTLWTVTRQWDWEWETKFAEWVTTELDAHWWKRHGIATDCADVVYSARWIFARNNGLPMANHLITGAVFSHESVKAEWESLPTATDWQEDQRFLAALDYLLSQAFTHSLWRDSYPVAIGPRSILPGGYHLYIDQQTGHTQFIYKTGHGPADLPLVTLNSTVPRERRDLMEWIFLEQSAEEDRRALLRMRWPQFRNGQVTFVQPAAMPYYSREQFAWNFIGGNHDTFWQEVYYRLNPRADFDLIAQKVVQQAIDLLKARVPVVENGYRECSLSPCQPGTDRYEAWSTPTRDHRIAETISIFDSLSSMINSWGRISQIMHTPILQMDRVEYSGADFIPQWRAQNYSSNPNDPPRARWGIR